MPRFAEMLANGLCLKGHEVKVWTARPMFYKLPAPAFLKKWFGYIDQFIVFPYTAKKKIKNNDKNALYVFTDNALGPWVSLAAHKKHVMHCHDFLAQHAALNSIPQSKTSFTGKLYQRYIRKGYRKAKHFICVSEKTRTDLLYFLQRQPVLCHVVYNGFNRSFEQSDKNISRTLISQKIDASLANGFIMHIGGNQWYKNREGVLDIYLAWRKKTNNALPLLMIGKPLPANLSDKIKQSDFAKEIFVLENADDELVYNAYNAAVLLLYPSIAEGFGWPIAEAQACGCAVITTNVAPMNEVGGEAAIYISPLADSSKKTEWLHEAAEAVEKFISSSDDIKQIIIEKGIKNAERFNTNNAIDKIELLYKKIINAEPSDE